MDRADLRGELLRREIEDLGAHQIGWHQIRRALHSLERSGHGSRQRLRGRGLGQTRYGFDENMFLDPATRTYVEETGGANFIFITKDGKFVTPKSDSILPSITRRSLMYIAEHYLG